MINDTTKFRLELDVAGQHLVSAFQNHQEEVAEYVKAGVEKAVKEFDFENAVAEKAKQLISNIISDFMWRGELRKLIELKVSGIVQELIDKEMERFN